MKIKANTVKEYYQNIDLERKAIMEKLHHTIDCNLPVGFECALSYGMPGWVVPLSYFPDGYHCKKDTPLPFISIASQKNFIALYHMGIYADANLLDWFVSEFPKHSSKKLDMGKSCIRFKKMEEIPFDLIGELCQKMNRDQWIKLYQDNYLKK
jgi:hypothetical protein